jgi:hypothetical protein
MQYFDEKDKACEIFNKILRRTLKEIGAKSERRHPCRQRRESGEKASIP